MFGTTLMAMLDRRRFLLLSASALAAASCTEKPAAGGGAELRIGMDLTYPPFEMQDKAGKPDGVGVKIVPMQFTGLIPALQTGNIDLILSSMTATEERRKSIDFSDPYAFTGLAILVQKDSDIQSIEDLKKPGRSLTAKAATTGQIWITDKLPSAKLVVFEDEASCVQEVAQGRADAFIYDQLSIYRYSKENPDTTRGLLKAFVEESWALGVAKGNDALREQVNEFIKAFRADGGFEKLGGQYLADEKKFLESQGIPFIIR
jgi:polar amino acid transport system substrate-binding protein